MPAVAELREIVTGRVIDARSHDYDAAREVWNAAIDRHPSVIVQCAAEDDVAASLAYARERDLRVAVRGGGHSVAGMGTCDDGLVIHLSGLADVSVDPERRVGKVGVVTEFTFRAHPVPRQIPVGLGLWAIDDLERVLRVYRELMPAQPDEVKATIFVFRARADMAVPRATVGKPVLMICQPWIGDDVRAARRAFGPLIDAAPPIDAAVEAMPWLDLQTMDDHISGHGKGNYTKGGYLDAIDDGVVAALLDAALDLPSNAAQVEVIPHGGAQLRVAEQDSAFSDRAAAYSFNVFARWHRDDEPDRHIAWARRHHRAFEQHATGGVYTNFFSADDGQDRVLAAYGSDKYERLAALKAKYDPGNVFALNGNIRPAAPPV
jgi:FAD/FMN-containing dehydrogenase